MSFDESFKDFSTVTDFRILVDENFNRQSGIYTFLSFTQYVIKLNNEKLILPDKIVFEHGYQRFRRKSQTRNVIQYKKANIEIIEKTQIVPFGAYKRKFKFSGQLSEIIEDLNIFSKNDSPYLFSSSLLDTANYPLFGIDSKIKFPSYLVAIKQNETKLDDYNLNVLSKYDEETVDFVKDAIATINIHYDIRKINKYKSFVIFPIPYLEILQNQLNIKGDVESVVLTIKKNNAFYPIFKFNSLKIKYWINELGSERQLDGVKEVSYSSREIQEIEIVPQNIRKIGKVKIEVFIDAILVNKFQGNYLRNIKFNLNLKKNE